MLYNNKHNETFFSEKTGKTLALGGIVFISISIAIFLIFGDWKFSTNLNEEKIGQFGDFIGGLIGSIFSLAGVILFYVALKEQRRDININQSNLQLQTEALTQQVDEFKAQKEELSATRKVYEEQTTLIREQTNLYKQQYIELKEQTSISKLQQFDSSFFSYLAVLSNCRKKLNDSCKSNNFFLDIYSEISNIKIDGLSLSDSLEKINAKYLETFQKNKTNLSIYFKTLYRIMVLIDSSFIDDYKKIEYFKLLRAQITDEEQIILYYNYQTHLGVKVRSLVIKYNFLKYIRALDKFEYCSNLDNKSKYEMEIFLSEIEKHINENIAKYTNLETENDIDFSINYTIFNLKLKLVIKIDGGFQFSIIFTESEFMSNSIIKKEEMEKLINRHLYSLLFLKKYKKLNENEIIDSIIVSQGNIEFKFEIENIENI